MRLFVALRPPAYAVEHAAGAVDAVRARHPGPCWVPPRRWHLTLAFHGEVPDADVGRLTARTARRLATATAMDLALAGAGQFTRRAVWLGVTGDLEPLRALAGRLATDRRAYRPHLTVARLRGDVDATPAVADLAGYAGPTWRADVVALVRSTQGPSPAYDDIATWTLAPRP